MSFKLLSKWLICQRILLFPGIKSSYWLLKPMGIRNDIMMCFCGCIVVPFEGTGVGGRQESLCSWKWKHLNNGLSEGPQMLGSRPRTPAYTRTPHLGLQFWKCRRWVEVPGMLEKGRWANRWTVNREWKSAGQRTRACVTENLGQNAELDM